MDRLAALAPALFALAIVVLAATPRDVAAHAFLRASQPAAGATVAVAPAAIALTFSETPDPVLSSVQVVDADGADHVAGPLSVVTEPPATITAPLGNLGVGVYTVSWRAVSAIDGHISVGSFAFGVGTPPPSAAPGSAVGGVGEDGSIAAIAARWLLYLGIVALFGAAWIALAVVRVPAGDLLLMAAAGWVLTFIGTIAVVGVQWSDTGASLETLIGASIGMAAIARMVSLALVGAALVGLAVVPALGGARGWAAAALASASVLLVDVATGHAAAGPGWPIQVAVQTAHGLAAAAWLGGLVGLLLILRSVPSGDRLDTARRYSSWVGIALAVVAVTGAVRGWAEIGTLDRLVDTDSGRIVVAKSVLLIALAGLGAFNRFFTLRDAARLMSRVRRIGVIEIAVAAAVLALAAVLVNLPPPALTSNTNVPAARSLRVTGIRASPGLGQVPAHVTMEVTP